MDLVALSDFILVATHGGIGRASRASGRPKATLSRRIMELEDSLGVRLVERGPRALRLTEEGAALQARTEGLLAEIAEAGKAAGAGGEQPRGRLRISAPVLFATLALGRIAAGFRAAHPEVSLEVIAEDRQADLIDDGYDLVIRINPRPDAALVGRCVLRDRLVIVAAAGMPRPPEGDEAVPLPAVMLAAPHDGAWRYAAAGRLQAIRPVPVLRLSSLIMVHQATLAGAGVAMLSEAMVAGDVAAGRLACWGVVPDRPVAIWALHASRRLPSRKVTAFVQYLCDAFPDGRLG